LNLTIQSCIERNSSSESKGIPDIENIVVKTVDGRPVYLSELAEIKIGGAIRRGLQTRHPPSFQWQ
jgi:cobalt-zinc-cadmium resistance protein CzcA